MKTSAKINRRSLLTNAVGVASTVCGFPWVVPGSALGKDGRTAPSNRVILGSIGVGSMGKGDMKSLMRVAGTQMVAVCDVVEQRRKEAKGIVDDNYGNKNCKAYGDFRDLLAREDIDAVSVTTQDHWRRRPARMFTVRSRWAPP